MFVMFLCNNKQTIVYLSVRLSLTDLQDKKKTKSLAETITAEGTKLLRKESSLLCSFFLQQMILFSFRSDRKLSGIPICRQLFAGHDDVAAST